MQALRAAVNAHDVDRAAALFADGYEGFDVSRAAVLRGRRAVREALGDWLRAFPDLHLSLTEVTAQPGRVALAWTKQGTHRGAFLHVPPTGRRLAVCGLSVLTLERGKIARGLHLWDLAGLLRAMKLLPDLPGDAPQTGQDALLAAFLKYS